MALYEVFPRHCHGPFTGIAPRRPVMPQNRLEIVDCAIYRSGLREEVPGDISDALDSACKDGDAFMWIGLHEPTEETFRHVNEELKLHPLAVDDALSGEHQRSKLERYGEWHELRAHARTPLGRR